MNKFTLVVATVLLLSPAYAAEPKQAPAKQEAGSMTIADCLTVLNGLNSLDGRQELTKDNTAVTLAYRFENAKLRAVIQGNIAALNVVRTDLQTVLQNIFKEVAGEKLELPPNTPEFLRYKQQENDAQQLPCSAQLVRIDIKDLKLDKNEIPGSVLGALDKILDK